MLYNLANDQLAALLDIGCSETLDYKFQEYVDRMEVNDTLEIVDTVGIQGSNFKFTGAKIQRLSALVYQDVKFGRDFIEDLLAEYQNLTPEEKCEYTDLEPENDEYKRNLSDVLYAQEGDAGNIFRLPTQPLVLGERLLLTGQLVLTNDFLSDSDKLLFCVQNKATFTAHSLQKVDNNNQDLTHCFEESNPRPERTSTDLFLTNTDDNKPLSGCAEDEWKLLKANPGLSICKKVRDFDFDHDTVTYTFEVTNCGNVDLENVCVTDYLLSSDAAESWIYNKRLSSQCGSIDDSGPYAPKVDLLKSGDSYTFDADLKNASDYRDLETGIIRNVAEATGFYKTNDGQHEEVGPVTSEEVFPTAWAFPNPRIVPNPCIKIFKSVKSANFECDELVYELSIVNCGNVALSDIHVTDSIVGEAKDTSGCCESSCSPPPAHSGKRHSLTLEDDHIPSRLEPGECVPVFATLKNASCAMDCNGLIHNEASVSACYHPSRAQNSSQNFLSTDRIVTPWGWPRNHYPKYKRCGCPHNNPCLPSCGLHHKGNSYPYPVVHHTSRTEQCWVDLSQCVVKCTAPFENDPLLRDDASCVFGGLGYWNNTLTRQMCYTLEVKNTGCKTIAGRNILVVHRFGPRSCIGKVCVRIVDDFYNTAKGCYNFDVENSRGFWIVPNDLKPGKCAKLTFCAMKDPSCADGCKECLAHSACVVTCRACSITKSEVGRMVAKMLPVPLSSGVDDHEDNEDNDNMTTEPIYVRNQNACSGGGGDKQKSKKKRKVCKPKGRSVKVNAFGGYATLNLLSEMKSEDEEAQIELVKPPVHGSLEFLPGSYVKYKHSGNRNGDRDSFTYRLVKHQCEPSDLATITIQIGDESNNDGRRLNHGHALKPNGGKRKKTKREQCKDVTNWTVVLGSMIIILMFLVLFGIAYSSSTNDSQTKK